MTSQLTPTEWETGLIELAPEVFAYIQGKGTMGISNAGLVLGMGGPLLVDALVVPRLAKSLKRAIRRVTPVPPRYVFNTHHHIDHIGGNSTFMPADIIASRRCREEIVRLGLPLAIFKSFMPRFEKDFDEVRLSVPNITFERTLTMHSDRHEVSLRHLGAAHTAGDAIAYLPAEKTLYTGDLAFFYVTPLGFQGHIGNWIEIIDQLLELDVERIVPGHGPVGDKDDLRRMQDYLKLVHTRSQEAFAAGLSVEQAIADIDLGEFAEWAEPERLAFNVGRCYQEFRGDISTEDVSAPPPGITLPDE